MIAGALKAGDEVRLTGFGVFVVATRAGGKGRNPQTGEEITIKPSKQPRFRAGKQLKEFAELDSRRWKSSPARRVKRAEEGDPGFSYRDPPAGGLAQPVEHIVYTDGVGGSNPSPPTRLRSRKQANFCDGSAPMCALPDEEPPSCAGTGHECARGRRRGGAARRLHHPWRPRTARDGGRRKEWHPPVEILLRYADKDGRVTRAAMEAGLRKDFDAADINHDGVLEPDEVRAVNQKRWNEDQSAASPLVDWNGDGVVDFDEFAATARSLFDEYDKNHDGVLTPDELHPKHAGPGKAASRSEHSGHGGTGGHGARRRTGGGGPPAATDGGGNPGHRGYLTLTWLGAALHRPSLAAEAAGARGGVAQLVRVTACHAVGRGFEPRRSRQPSLAKQRSCPA